MTVNSLYNFFFFFFGGGGGAGCRWWEGGRNQPLLCRISSNSPLSMAGTPSSSGTPRVSNACPIQSVDRPNAGRWFTYTEIVFQSMVIVSPLHTLDEFLCQNYSCIRHFC